MTTASPLERTLVWLRELGYTVDKVEHRNPFGKVTVDFMGWVLFLGGRLAKKRPVGGRAEDTPL